MLRGASTSARGVECLSIGEGGSYSIEESILLGEGGCWSLASDQHLGGTPLRWGLGGCQMQPSGGVFSLGDFFVVIQKKQSKTCSACTCKLCAEAHNKTLVRKRTSAHTQSTFRTFTQ